MVRRSGRQPAPSCRDLRAERGHIDIGWVEAFVIDLMWDAWQIPGKGNPHLFEHSSTWREPMVVTAVAENPVKHIAWCSIARRSAHSRLDRDPPTASASSCRRPALTTRQPPGRLLDLADLLLCRMASSYGTRQIVTNGRKPPNGSALRPTSVTTRSVCLRPFRSVNSVWALHYCRPRILVAPLSLRPRSPR